MSAAAVSPVYGPDREGRDPVGVGLVALTLLLCLWQPGLGSRMSETGEQMGLALPVSTLGLLAALVLQGVRRRLPALPLLSRTGSLFLVLVGAGILATTRLNGMLAGKELYQLLEILVLMPWLVQSISGRGRRFLLVTLGLFCPYLLAAMLSQGTEGRPLLLSNVKASCFVLLSLPLFVLLLRERARILLVAALLAVSAGAGGVFTSGGLLVVWLIVLLLSLVLLLPEKRFAVGLGLVAGCLMVVTSLHLPVTGTPAWRTLNPRYDGSHLTRSALEMRASLRAPRYLPLGAGLGAYKSGINQLKLYDGRTPHPADMKVTENSNGQVFLTLVEAGLPAAVAIELLFLLASLRLMMSGRWGGAGDRALGVALFALIPAGFFASILSRGIGLWVGALLGLAATATPDAETVRRLPRLVVPALYLALSLGALFLFNTPSYAPDDESRLSLLARALLFGDEPSSFGLRILPYSEAAESGEGIRIEGESGVVSSPFVILPVNSVSGGKVISLPPHAPKGTGEVAYEVDIPVDGSYQLVAMVWWNDGCSNSIAFSTEGEQIVIGSNQYRSWHRVESRSAFSLKAGRRTILIQGLESGVQVDYWQLKRQ